MHEEAIRGSNERPCVIGTDIPVSEIPITQPTAHAGGDGGRFTRCSV